MPAYQTTIDNRTWTWTAADAPAFAEALRKELNHAACHYPQFIEEWPVRANLPAGQTVRNDTAEHWLQDVIRLEYVRKLPNFDDAVKVIIATFAVFTGLTITRYLVGDKPQLEFNLGDYAHWRWWGFFALVALLLRYIIGSAVHLNHTYGGGIPRSHSTWLLFKDLAFLVVFGMIAFYTMKAETISDFIWRSMVFLAWGFGWSVSDYLIRRMWGRYIQWTLGDAPLFWHDVIYCGVLLGLAIALFCIVKHLGLHGCGAGLWVIIFLLTGFALIATDKLFPARITLQEWPASFSRIWVGLDGGQFIFSWVILRLPYSDLSKAVLLVAFYVGFLYFDMKALNRMLRES